MIIILLVVADCSFLVSWAIATIRKRPSDFAFGYGILSIATVLIFLIEGTGERLDVLGWVAAAAGISTLVESGRIWADAKHSLLLKHGAAAIVLGILLLTAA
jgi:hypothetical protein